MVAECKLVVDALDFGRLTEGPVLDLDLGTSCNGTDWRMVEYVTVPRD